MSARKRLLAAWSGTIDWKMPRSSRRLMSLVKKPSTALTNDADICMKWKVKRLPGSASRCTRTPAVPLKAVAIDQDGGSSWSSRVT